MIIYSFSFQRLYDHLWNLWFIIHDSETLTNQTPVFETCFKRQKQTDLPGWAFTHLQGSEIIAACFPSFLSLDSIAKNVQKHVSLRHGEESLWMLKNMVLLHFFLNISWIQELGTKCDTSPENTWRWIGENIVCVCKVSMKHGMWSKCLFKYFPAKTLTISQIIK